MEMNTVRKTTICSWCGRKVTVTNHLEVMHRHRPMTRSKEEITETQAIARLARTARYSIKDNLSGEWIA
jgi:hypothetical protein